MKIPTKITTPDYREAFNLFTVHKIDHARIQAVYDKESDTWNYVVSWLNDCHTESERNRQFLANIYHSYDLPIEELDALCYAEQAIKTLVDMGVLE